MLTGVRDLTGVRFELGCVSAVALTATDWHIASAQAEKSHLGSTRLGIGFGKRSSL
ncbi:MAG: hypothetical protein SPJ68_07640 [Arcanobacterium sp.]|nr:hypothetical protein [Arcanobacterium sp.]